MPAAISAAETRNMRKAVATGFLGWTIDAFDFFVLVFCVSAIAKDFGRSVPDVALAITASLVTRPVGAFVFGLLAEKFDHIAVLTTFVITPLVFVGGVFTSTRFMPPLVREISFANPMFYMIDAFRFAFTGTGDVPLAVSLGTVTVLTFAALAIALRMMVLGVKLRL